MQWRLVSVFPCLFLASMGVRAEDSAAVTELPETVITAARVPQSQREVIGDVTLITSKDLEVQRGQTLVDVLSEQAGVQFTSNGGVGKTTSVFLRGANAAHTLVLIDGMRYGSATTGAASLQNLPLEQIDRIEILRGAAASLYGSDAIGGVIQIFTRQGGKTPKASVEVGLGSNNTREVNANVAASVGDTRYALGVAHNETDGINAIRNPANSSYYPDRDGYSNTSASLSVSHKINSENEVGANLLFAKSRNHYDSYVLDSSYNSVAQSYDYREDDKQGAASVWSRHQLMQNWTARLLAG
ncbi:MAG: TonB-dependent receptor plug domain-containing protein, partial [Formivibrio sp.]|nr:TonB-dependent receptor plug domain-containing protein [Formivibrio sp.]